MATVFRVADQATGRRLALKQLRGSATTEAGNLRFRHEFHTVARLHHPCIVEVYDFGIAEGRPYYTMELLEGEDLKLLCPLDPVQACRVLRDIAAGLGVLHANGLVHRDVAPGNVRLDVSGRAKLIDFGVIASMGVAAEIAGTPQFMAPEALRGQPLDQRADLFGLGALGYWLLTGRQPFGNRTIQGRAPGLPPAPSKCMPGVWPELDQVILALLSADPLARPSTAAEVVDRFEAVARLDPDPAIAVDPGLLANASLIGRRREMTRLVRQVRRVVDGAGSTVLIEGPAGHGKTRLLREATLEAQLAGATVISVSSDAGRGPYGVVRAIARELLATAAVDALAAAEPRAAVLARVLPEIRAKFPSQRPEPPGNPREERLAVQGELVEWIGAIAANRKLVLLVDDVQRCDEASAAVLVTLALECDTRPLLLVATQRTDEAVRAPAAIAALRDAARRLTLRGLGPEDTEAFARALFGDVPRIGMLARWMYDCTGGSPLHCMELARHLVDHDIVRHAAGSWVIPDQVQREDVPKGLMEALDARVASLRPMARAVAEVLSVHGRALPLELCARLLETTDADQVFASLDELEVAGILVRSEDGYQFRHAALREALLRRVDDRHRRRLHLRIGEALLAANPGGDADPDVGWHLLHGGEAMRGAVILDAAGRRLFETQSFADAAPLLEAALGVYEREDAPRLKCLELRTMLLGAGQTSDRALALRYADDTIATLYRMGGLHVATRLRRVLGLKLALIAGLVVAGVARLFTRPRRRGPRPMQAIRQLLFAVGYTASVHATAADRAKLLPLHAIMEPFGALRDRVPNASRLLLRCFDHYIQGHMAELRRDSAEALRILQTDTRTRYADHDRRLAIGGLRVLRAIAGLLTAFPEEELEALDKLGLRFFEIGALQVRISYHRFRGEEDKARELVARAEVLFVQLGAMPQLDAWQAGASAYAYAHNRDVPGLTRVIAKLTDLVDQGYAFGAILDLTRGEYLRERGDPEGARTVLERLLARIADDDELVGQPARIALAETLLALGDLERAEVAAREALERASNPAVGRLTHELRAVRVLALVEARRGRVDEAVRLLADGIQRAEALGYPSVCGLMHEARARVALAAGEKAAFRLHLDAAERWLRPTRNPALIAQVDQLAAVDNQRSVAGEATDVTRTALLGQGRLDAGSGTAETQLSVVRVAERLARVATRDDCAAEALSILCATTGATAGVLYMADDTGVPAEAARIGTATTDLDAAVADLLEETAGVGDRSDWDSWEGTPVPASLPGGWRPVVLRGSADDRGPPPAVALLEQGSRPLDPPGRAICSELARQLSAWPRVA